MLVCCAYISWPKQFKPLKVLTVIVVLSYFLCWNIVHCFILLCDLQVMNVQHNLIRKIMVYVFMLGHDVMEASKNAHLSGGVAVDHSIVLTSHYVLALFAVSIIQAHETSYSYSTSSPGFVLCPCTNGIYMGCGSAGVSIHQHDSKMYNISFNWSALCTCWQNLMIKICKPWFSDWPNSQYIFFFFFFFSGKCGTRCTKNWN